jgi:hypothetical protein
VKVRVGRGPILRIGLIAATVLGFGAGIVIYLACWLIVPEEEIVLSRRVSALASRANSCGPGRKRCWRGRTRTPGIELGLEFRYSL